MFFNSVKEINRLTKEINSLFSKRISNTYLSYYWEKLTFSKLSRYHWILNFLVKNQRSGRKTVCGFSIILILEGVITYKVESVHAFCLTKIQTLIKMKQNLKWKIPHTVFERWILCFSSYKNRKLKVKLWWVGAPERKEKAFFVPFILFTVYLLLYDIFHGLLTHSNHSNTEKPTIYDTVPSLSWLEKHLIFDQSCF